MSGREEFLRSQLPYIDLKIDLAPELKIWGKNVDDWWEFSVKSEKVLITERNLRV
ncbi:hypothetical protein M8C21_007175 [Ambrosia artemisiifolia]|uniref:Uncharacterized protein n=1 Tax=Ambrosia artemisiifolia TaxID=4212 RepID=A0AAD5DFZ0_AMBAR|nr:hypothetical protein M8C21_007175 [Ambrosia artemisiifolia]